MKAIIYKIIILTVCVNFLASCREDDYVQTPVIKTIAEPDPDNYYQGVYILNEGSMGMNKASLDYFDYATGVYSRNIYPQANPDIVKELGDVGNDLKIYGSKLYAVINCSHKIEVMDAYTAKRIKKIDVNNCRYLAFHDGKAYISSYAGPVGVDPNAQKGFVAEIDTATLEITRTVIVGYQPEEIVIHDNKLYVANSGGYRFPNYDRTISVVDMNTFTEIDQIDVAVNLHHLKIDSRGDLYVNSRGDYYDIPSALYVVDPKTNGKQEVDLPVSNMVIVGDSLYAYSTEFSYITGKTTITYGIINTESKEVVNRKLITDGTDSKIVMPYGLAVHPYSRDIFVTDAQNYIATGYVYCYTAEGKLKWKVTAGNIPAHFAFLPKR